jgi:hypothetical protein
MLLVCLPRQLLKGTFLPSAKRLLEEVALMKTVKLAPVL